MDVSIGGGLRGVVADVDVVPLIDILLVLLVIFMVSPQLQYGLDAQVPQQSSSLRVQPEAVVVQVLADGSLRINQDPVSWVFLAKRLAVIFKLRADRTAFVRGDRSLEFESVARAIDAMNSAGAAPIGLLTPELELGH